MKKHFIVIVSLIGLVAMPAWAGEVALIVHPDNPVTSISRAEAKNIFLGKKASWEDDKTIRLFLQSGTSVHDDFLRKVMKKSPQQYLIFWKKKLFLGTGIPPMELQGDTEMKRFVAAEKKAIGYIDAASADDSVKILTLK